MDVSDYLGRRHAADQSMAKDVQLQADSALNTLVKTHLRGGGWPYALANGKPLDAGGFSQSTVAMILHAVAAAYGRIPASVLVPAVRTSTVRTGTGKKRNPDDVQRLLSTGTSVLIESLNNTLTESHGRELTRSGTWGVNDPLTLTWVHELLTAGIIDNAESRPILRKIKDIIDHQAEKLTKNPGAVVLTLDSKRAYPVEHHPFVLLRTLQLAKAVDVLQWSDLRLGELPSYLLNRLHTELSNSDIRDGGFDPACLVFALEGLLITNPDAITDHLLQQVVDVLSSAQRVEAHWRPVRPLIATNAGYTLLPQSVEVANSYLRSCGHLDSAKRITATPLFTRSFEVLQSYTDWLLSCVLKLRIPIGGKDLEFEGWQSEHTYRRDIVHLWATSQVVLFLQHYSAMLQQHIAFASRSAANLDFRRQTTAANKWASEWEDKKSREPMLGLPETSIFRAYNRVDDLFVSPRIDKNASTRASYSLLLYGPPGTGKTSFCKALAEAIGFDLIIVSPSDFIRSGEAGVEDRAKRVFDVLLSQSDAVILFDEIDRLLLDRDSPEYERQGDMFQFMTPSMLTKLNDLRSEERSIFVIATNYAERIDGAIKRPGRIDEQIALLPPDIAQRRIIIEDSADKIGLSLRQSRIENIARQTPLYIYSELEHLIQSIADSKAKGLSLEKAVAYSLDQHSSPTISLESYRGRFELVAGQACDEARREPPGEGARKDGLARKPTSAGPWKEFALLAYLQAETNPDEIPGWAHRVLRDVLDNPKLCRQLESEILPPLQAYIEQIEDTG